MGVGKCGGAEQAEQKERKKNENFLVSQRRPRYYLFTMLLANSILVAVVALGPG